MQHLNHQQENVEEVIAKEGAGAIDGVIIGSVQDPIISGEGRDNLHIALPNSLLPSSDISTLPDASPATYFHGSLLSSIVKPGIAGVSLPSFLGGHT